MLKCIFYFYFLKKNSGSPYGVPAIHRVFQFLTNLINPAIKRNEATRFWFNKKKYIYIYKNYLFIFLVTQKKNREFGLRLINMALEACGLHIGEYPDLMGVVKDDLCKQLLHCSQSKNLKILSLALRIVFDLFIAVKEHLKVQLEVFFTRFVCVCVCFVFFVRSLCFCFVPF